MTARDDGLALDGWRSSAVDVAARGVGDGRVTLASHGRGVGATAGPPPRPPGPVLPPGPAVMRRGRPPPRRGYRVGRFGLLVPGLRAGRIHDSGDVPAAGQHVTNIPAQ